jgi:NADP-dependent 3-hydroxy acid dehydrogenase YdfG
MTKHWQLGSRCQPQWKRIDLLLNNAGLAAGLAPIDKGNWAHWEQMIDTNVKGLLFIISFGYSSNGGTATWPSG